MPISGSSTVALAPIILSILNIVAGLISNQLVHPKEQYQDTVRSIQEDRWHDVCDELGSVVSKVYEYISQDSNDYAPDDLSEAPTASLLLRQALVNNRAELEDAEKQLERLDEPKVLYKTCRQSSRRALWLFVSSLILSVILVAGAFLLPTTIEVIIVETIFLVVGIIAFLFGIYYTYRSDEARNELDKMDEDTDFM